jgi:hypothetical protein
MIEGLVRAALKQRLIVLVVAAIVLAFGINAARKLSVDAFPDVTNVQVQIATEAPGRSPEEVERFVTVPLEIATTGLPGLVEMRSLNKPGLSLITLVFTDATNVYFARQLVMERLIEVGASLPEGVVPVLGPVSSALGEVYQYMLVHPDDGKRELTRQDRQAVPGAGRSRPAALLRRAHPGRVPGARAQQRQLRRRRAAAARRAVPGARRRPDPRPGGHPQHRAQGVRRDPGFHP